jgi:hypothetical protein
LARASRREQRAAHVEVHDRAPLAALLGPSVDCGITSAGRIAPIVRLIRASASAASKSPAIAITMLFGVVGGEELAADPDGRLLDVAAPADRRRAMGAPETEREQRLVGASHRHVSAHPPLLEHHLPLAVERRRADVEVGEPSYSRR